MTLIAPKRLECLRLFEDDETLTSADIARMRGCRVPVAKVMLDHMHKAALLIRLKEQAGRYIQYRIARPVPNTDTKSRSKIPIAELEYLAELRKNGATGQELCRIFRERYPNITEGQVKYRVKVAREAGLFRRR